MSDKDVFLQMLVFSQGIQIREVEGGGESEGKRGGWAVTLIGCPAYFSRGLFWLQQPPPQR